MELHKGRVSMRRKSRMKTRMEGRFGDVGIRWKSGYGRKVAMNGGRVGEAHTAATADGMIDSGIRRRRERRVHIALTHAATGGRKEEQS